MNFKKLVVVFWGLLMLPLAALAEQPDPLQVVKETVAAVITEVETNREQLESDPAAIYPLVDRLIEPRFDFAGMTRSAVGKHWRKATTDQKDQLIKEFRELLVGTYGTALLNYAGQEVEYLPVRFKQGDKKVVVRTKIVDTKAPPLAVNYSLRWKNEKWLVYNVEIANIKLTINYRGTFDSIVKKDGIDGLIESLVAKNLENRTAEKS